MEQFKITDLQLEQYLLGELPGELRGAIKSRLEADPELRMRVDKLRISDREILNKYPAPVISEKIQKKINEEKNSVSPLSEYAPALIKNRVKTGSLSEKFHDLYSRTSRRIIYSAAAASAAAAVIMFIFVSPYWITESGNILKDDDIVRIKGFEPGLHVYRKTATGTEELKNAQQAGQGDLIQIGYSTSGDYKYGTIVSIDGRGTVTLHYPDSEGGTSALKTNRKVMLERAYELDDSPAFEKFFLILSKHPVDVKSVLDKAKILALNREEVLNGKLSAGSDIIEFSLSLKK